jgi:hypothetical protein
LSFCILASEPVIENVYDGMPKVRGS